MIYIIELIINNEPVLYIDGHTKKQAERNVEKYIAKTCMNIIDAHSSTWDGNVSQWSVFAQVYTSISATLLVQK